MIASSLYLQHLLSILVFGIFLDLGPLAESNLASLLMFPTVMVPVLHKVVSIVVHFFNTLVITRVIFYDP